MTPGTPSEGSPGAVGGRSGRNLPVAIATGLLLAGLLLLTLFTSELAFFVLVAAAVLTAQVELYRALASRGHRPATVLGTAAGGLVLGAAYVFGADDRGPGAMTFALVMTVVAAMVWYLVDDDRSEAAAGVASTLFGVVYVPFLAAHVILMSRMPDGAWVVVAFIGLTAFYDIGAYAAGTFFGKHLVAPSVSPKKTWEGAAGATLLVFLLALLVVPLMPPFTAGSASLLALVTVILAPLGDLAESLVKRDLHIKDMGSILPGHGGVLDRIDALLLVAPAAFWVLRGIL